MRKRMQRVLAERGNASPVAHAGPWPLAQPFTIGELVLENRVVQAPLAGIANWAFRTQSRRHGAGGTVSEMIAAAGLTHGNRATREMLTIKPGESPMGVQLFGSDPEQMAEAARMVEQAGADFIDINMGCPVRKICRTGAGAALLDDPERAAAIVSAMVEAAELPVTVKMRRGVTAESGAPTDLARRFEQAGASAICFHPRAAADEYGGLSDHRFTAELVAAVGVPVIASGDIIDPAGALAVVEETGATAVAIGRGALGNPWLFGALARGEVPNPGRDEVREELVRFAGDVVLALGERRACHYLRKFYPWYLAEQKIPKARMTELQTAPTVADALALLAVPGDVAA